MVYLIIILYDNHNYIKGVHINQVVPEYIEPTALLILGYPKKGFLSPERHITERKLLTDDTVMYEKFYITE